jgi:hypothetical protein
LTCQPFNIGLYPQLRRLNPREFQYRQSLYTYAANDCDAILRIIIHSNLINDQYSEVAPHSKKKRNFTKPKKELSAGTASEPLVVSEKEGFVPNFFLMNGKNGFVRKVQYETFTEKRLKGFARNVQYETIPK